MKRFLYLIQSRAAIVSKHLMFETERSDVLILTFDGKIDGNNLIYAPKTTWAQGRNILIKAARELDRNYDYYIMMDDDIIFRTGSFIDFEDEVLELTPDLCSPAYYNLNAMRLYSRISPFPYSLPKVFDCCYFCVSAELFFDDRLFPYETEHKKINLGKNNADSVYSSNLLWLRVHKYFWDRKILTIQKFQHINSEGHVDYNYNPWTLKRFYSRILASEYLMNLREDLPLFFYQKAIEPNIKQLEHVIAKFETRGYLGNKLVRFFKFIFMPHQRKFKDRVIYHSLFLSYFHIFIKKGRFHYFKFLWQDFRLNLRINKGQEWKTSDF